MSFAGIISIANYSDGVLYALALLQLVALAVIVDRAWYLRRTILGGARLVSAAAAHTRLHHADLARLASSARDLPEASLIEVSLRAEGRLTRESLDRRLTETIMLAAPRLDTRLWVLDTVVTLAPLLGLFGTILGMFRAFSVLAAPGSAPAAVTGGVANALITTAAGIFVAMVGLLAYNGLSNAVRQVVHQMDTLSAVLLNRVVLSDAPMAHDRVTAVAAE
jgi:biopolymer transport protein ExbB